MTPSTPEPAQPALSRSKVLKRLRELMGARPTAEHSAPEIYPFGLLPMGKRPNYDDHTIVLIVGAVLDQALEGAIVAKLARRSPEDERMLFSDEAAPLQSLDAKIRMAYALGVIGPNAREDLAVIRRLRNTFAHSRLKLSFDTPEVAAATRLLTLDRRLEGRLGSCPGELDRFIQIAFQYTLQLIVTGEEREDEPGGFMRTTTLS